MTKALNWQFEWRATNTNVAFYSYLLKNSLIFHSSIHNGEGKKVLLTFLTVFKLGPLSALLWHTKTEFKRITLNCSDLINCLTKWKRSWRSARVLSRIVVSGGSALYGNATKTVSKRCFSCFRAHLSESAAKRRKCACVRRFVGGKKKEEVETCERNKRRRASERCSERRIQELNSAATASAVVRGLFGLWGDSGLVYFLSSSELFALWVRAFSFFFLYIFLPLCDTKEKKKGKNENKKKGATCAASLTKKSCSNS